MFIMEKDGQMRIYCDKKIEIKKITRKEDRKHYLARVMVAYLENSWDLVNGTADIIWDRTVGNVDVLIEDIQSEFDLK